MATIQLPRRGLFRYLPFFLFILILLVGCGRLDTIPYNPPQTPETWLTFQPYVEIELGAKTLILVQPSSTVFVYALGLLAIGVGWYFFRLQDGQRTRLWWGVALVLWGAGALFAGTSYEAFSYEIKCAGRANCIWTSGWEVVYLVLSVASINAMMLAEAYACSTGRQRKALSIYAVTNMVIYFIVVLVGAIVPIKFLISFEMLLIFTAPSVLLFLILNGRRYYHFRSEMDLALLGTWLALGVVIAVYFLYLVSGLTQTLWSRGIWFSENDVLHIGLILWMLYIGRVVAKRVEDLDFGS